MSFIIQFIFGIIYFWRASVLMLLANVLCCDIFFFVFLSFIFDYVLCLDAVLLMFVDIFVCFNSNQDYNTVWTVTYYVWLFCKFCFQIVVNIMELCATVIQVICFVSYKTRFNQPFSTSWNAWTMTIVFHSCDVFEHLTLVW